MRFRARLLAVPAIALVAASAPSQETAPKLPRLQRSADARLYIISPANGAEVSNPVTVRFGLAGMGVAPAGVASPNTGHHHLMIDAPAPPGDLPIPKDDHHLHFGGGQTEVTLTLAPGEHTLQLELADLNHIPFDPPLLSEPIKIRVK